MPYFTVDPALVVFKNKYPVEALYPVSNGYDTVIFPDGDYGEVKFVPKEAARFIAGYSAKVQVVEFKNLVGAYFEGGQVRSYAFRSSKQCSAAFSNYKGITDSIAVRFWGGCEDCEVRYSSFNRTGWFNPGTEAGCVLFSYGYSQNGLTYTPNINCGVRNCDIRGCWTDSAQVCHTVLDKFGEAPGCCIENCVMGFDPGFVTGDQMIDRMEQSGCDFKTGGTPENPVRFRGNIIYGTYKSLMNPLGYAICVQNTATDILIENNTVVDCWGGVSLGPPRPESGKFDRRTVFRNNRWRVRDHWCYFTDTCLVENDIIDCGKLEQQPVKPWLADRQFVNCNVLERGLPA